eukprot:scaffold4013_cov140-Isochrysis_galbana.AAC.5
MVCCRHARSLLMQRRPRWRQQICSDDACLPRWQPRYSMLPATDWERCDSPTRYASVLHLGFGRRHTRTPL